ncbi:MAG: peptidoglycan-binding protein, partial [Aureispira sp.]
MGLLERLAHLEEQISRYLDLHNNPHDTSVHNKTAEKLLKLLPLIQKLHASTDKDNTSHSKTISGSVGVGGDNKEEDVKAVQTLLEITVDGDCGPKTKAAIKQFQKDNNITPISGTIEPDSPTWKKLAGVDDTGSDHQNDGGNDNTPVTNRKIDNSVGADACNDEHDVRVVQTLMNENGYELTVNGTADDELTQYLKDFQRRKEQNPTGLVEPNDDTFVFLTGQTPEDDHPTITIDVNDTLQKS